MREKKRRRRVELVVVVVVEVPEVEEEEEKMTMESIPPLVKNIVLLAVAEKRKIRKRNAVVVVGVVHGTRIEIGGIEIGGIEEIENDGAEEVGDIIIGSIGIEIEIAIEIEIGMLVRKILDQSTVVNGEGGVETVDGNTTTSRPPLLIPNVPWS